MLRVTCGRVACYMPTDVRAKCALCPRIGENGLVMAVQKFEEELMLLGLISMLL